MTNATPPASSPSRRVPDDELGLEVFLSFDYRMDEIINLVFQAAASQIETTLKAAQELAQKNVEPGRGPSLHDGEGTDGHHTEIHGFDWEDSRQDGLKDAIKYRVNWKAEEGKKVVGMPRGQLYVEPLETKNDYTHQKRKINYGAFLELGFTPVIKRKLADGRVVEARGNFTRFPFLSPAMVQATSGVSGGIVHQFATAIKRELRDLAAVTPGKRKRKRIIESESIAEKGKVNLDVLVRKMRRHVLEPVNEIDTDVFARSQQSYEQTVKQRRNRS